MDEQGFCRRVAVHILQRKQHGCVIRLVTALHKCRSAHPVAMAVENDVAFGVCVLAVVCLVLGAARVWWLWWNPNTKARVQFVGVPNLLAHVSISVVWLVAHAAAQGHMPGVECHPWAIFVSWACSTLLVVTLLLHFGVLVRAFALQPGCFPNTAWFAVLPPLVVVFLGSISNLDELDIDACALTPTGRMYVVVCAAIQALLLLAMVHETRHFRPPYVSTVRLFVAWVVAVATAVLVAVLVARGVHTDGISLAETTSLCVTLVAWFLARFHGHLSQLWTDRRVRYIPTHAKLMPSASPHQFVSYLTVSDRALLVAYCEAWKTFQQWVATNNDPLLVTGGGFAPIGVRSCDRATQTMDAKPSQRFGPGVTATSILLPLMQEHPAMNLKESAILTIVHSAIVSYGRLLHKEAATAGHTTTKTRMFISTALDTKIQEFKPEDGCATARAVMEYVALCVVNVYHVYASKFSEQQNRAQRSVGQTSFLLKAAGLLPVRWQRHRLVDNGL